MIMERSRKYGEGLPSLLKLNLLQNPEKWDQRYVASSSLTTPFTCRISNLKLKYMERELEHSNRRCWKSSFSQFLLTSYLVFLSQPNLLSNSSSQRQRVSKSAFQHLSGPPPHTTSVHFLTLMAHRWRIKVFSQTPFGPPDHPFT